MRLDQWLQLRREGRLSAIPLGMSVALASSGDENASYDKFKNGDGHGRAYGHGGNYGNENGSWNGHGHGCIGDKDGNGEDGEYGHTEVWLDEDGRKSVFRFCGNVNGNSHFSINERLTQRFYEVKL